MVAFPLLIAAATLGFSLVDPEGKSLVPSSFPGGSSSRPLLSNHSSRWVFCYGVVLGMGLSSALSYEMRRRRTWEWVRVRLFSLLQESSSALVLCKFRKPTASDSVEGTAMPGPSGESKTNESAVPCGIRREVVSPDWCFTSTMTVTILTLYAGSELVPQSSVGVEFYYVVKGEGVYIRGDGDVEEAMKLTTDTCLVVDPFCVRGFKATGIVDLVLLRATDSVEGQDAARREQGSISTTVALLNTGLKKVEALVSSYAKSPRGESRR